MNKTLSGEIEEFDVRKARGRVRLAEQDGHVEFPSTCFFSGNPARFPRTGEKVEVIFQPDGRILMIRSK